MSQQPKGLNRLLGFGTVVGFSAVSGVLQVVVLVRLLGPRAWGDVALAQSAAALAGAAVGLGWSSVGASVIATHHPTTRVSLFAQSLVARGYALLLCAPVLFLVVFALSTVSPWAIGLLAVAGLLPVLGASWYFVGQGTPSRLLMRDALPQIAGMMTGLLCASRWGVAGLATAVLVGNLVAVWLGVRGVMDDGPLALTRLHTSPRGAYRFMVQHRDALVASWAGSVNSYMPTIIVARLAATALPSFALADRLLRYALAGFSPVVQFAQGWVPANPLSTGRRARAAVASASVIGLAGGGIVSISGGPVVRLLSGGNVGLRWTLLLPFGVVVGVLMIGQITAFAVLVPLRMTGVLAASTAAGTAVLVLVSIPMVLNYGGPGMAWSMAACELVAVSWQVLAVMWRTRRRGWSQ